MSGGDWWSDQGDYNYQDGQSQYDPAQTAATQNQLDPNTTYSPPGQSAPIDQYNYVPDPNAPGGYQEYAPGVPAPDAAQSFSNQSGQYPNDQSMANAIANQSAYVQPTIDQMGNADFYQQYASLGSNLPQFTPEMFGSLPQETQDLFNGTYPGQGAQIWAQQANQNARSNTPPQPSTWNTYNNLTYSPGNNWYDPATGRHSGWGSIGAGTQWTAPGWGVPGFGQEAQQITPQNWAVLSNPQLQQQLAPGYIPGSGTYNQFNLSNGNLFGNIAGVMSNLNYGVGGPGDPTTGLEQQTPEEWVQGGKLFNWSGNMGQTADTQGLDYIATLFGRSDTPSGIGTPTWSAPKQYWDGLAQAVGRGLVQPTARGWSALAAKGYTPQGIGGAAPQQAQSVGYGQGGAGGTGTGQGPMGAGTQAFNYQAAYLDYLTAMMNNVSIPQLQNQNQQFHDQLAFEQAKQAWLQQYQQQVFGEGQRQFDVNTGLQQGQLTGMYNGQETLGQKALNQQTSLNYLNLLSQLRGPGDIFQYMKVLNGTPGGIRDIVNAAAGAYRMPGTSGGPTVGGYSNPSDLGTLLDQMNNPNYGAEAQNLNLPLPNQINALALQRMTPSQQQMLLGAYEAAGYNPQDVMSILRNSLPQYASQGNAGRVALFR